ncbi:MAG: RpiB/LacA/LacB family sugar-phosphate isomerase [Erysipelotrichaceae bacterium]|nr:RpiB/LacA/LacB family sugar-phosphate isomerase [Erysipelotrichaceae bacterium]
MKVIIGACSEAVNLKDVLCEWMNQQGIEVEDVTKESMNFFEASEAVVKEVLKNKDEDRGIIVDETGAGAFMCASKHNGIICAQLNDEHSAKMTRDHNNANVITMGCRVVGSGVAIGITERFLKGKYSAGRHKIRIDMLDRMGEIS